MEEDVSPEKIENVITHFLNCRNGCVTNNIEEDPVGAKIENKYFSSEKFDNMFDTILSNIQSVGVDDKKGCMNVLIK